MSSFVFSRPPAARYEVPHERVSERLLLGVHLAVARAFELVREDGFPLGSAGENQITEKLEDALENRVRNRGEVVCFDSDWFADVRRGSEVVNYDGKKISKKPDLVFKLRREHRIEWDQRQDAIFAECKPVDQKHKLKDHYCAVGKDCTGIERFIIGDYAWAMEAAFMIGYVRGGWKLARDLHPELADASRHFQLGSPTSLLAMESAAFNSHTELLHRTTHQRLFEWRENRKPATPIDIFHSWHCCQ